LFLRTYAFSQFFPPPHALLRLSRQRWPVSFFFFWASLRQSLRVTIPPFFGFPFALVSLIKRPLLRMVFFFPPLQFLSGWRLFKASLFLFFFAAFLSLNLVGFYDSLLSVVGSATFAPFFFCCTSFFGIYQRVSFYERALPFLFIFSVAPRGLCPPFPFSLIFFFSSITFTPGFSRLGILGLRRSFHLDGLTSGFFWDIPFTCTCFPAV